MFLLTSSPGAIFDVRGKLLDDDEILLTAEQFDTIVQKNTILHPLTGELIINAREHVQPIFFLRHGVAAPAS
jgi:hypothetical protein